MTNPSPQPPDHAWIHDRLAAAVAGGLTPEEQSLFDAHIHACSECFDAYTEARDADRALQRALDALTPPPPADHLEDRLVTRFREKAMKSQFHPFAKRAGFAIAAAVALAATGVFGQYVVQGNFLNNPLSKQLAAHSVLPPLPPFFHSGFAQNAAPASTPPSYGPIAAIPTDDTRYRMGLRLKQANDESKDRVQEQRQITFSRSGGGGGFGGRVTQQARAPQAVAQLNYFSPTSSLDMPAHATGGNRRAMNGPMSIAASAAPSTGLPATDAGIAFAGEEKSPGQTESIPAPSASPSAPPSQAAAPAPEDNAINERKIIRNGTIEFEVRSFDDAFATISSITHEEGGFISSTSSDKLANGKVRGSVVVRVPPDHLDRLLLKLRALGDLKSQQIGATDVTKQYIDLQSELAALRAMEGRLLDIIKNGKGQIKDLVLAEKQLGDYRVRIEKIEGDIRYYNNLVGMATLTINAYEKDIQTPTAAQEQENITVALETEDVEARYADARKIIDDAKGRITDSELKKHDAGEYAAQITADVPPDQADFVAAQLKQLGTLAAFNRDRKETTTGGSGAPTVAVEQKPTRFSISLYNLANIAPRETAVLTIAVPDVEAAYQSVLAAVRKGGGGADTHNRIITSALNGQQPEQMTADIRADVVSAEADPLLHAIRALGEVMTNSLTENPDTANVTSAKRGIQLRLLNTVAVPARESRALTLVAAQVPNAYGKLIADLQTLQSAGQAHLFASQLNQTDPRTISATLAFDVRRDALPAIDKAFADAGIDTLARNISRSTDTANTLDTKVHFQIDQLQSADTLPPVRTTTLGIEADHVEQSLDTLRAQLDKDGITHIQYSISREPSGQVTGHLVADIPLADAMTLRDHIRAIGGDEKMNQVVDDPQVPRTRFATERIDLTLSSRAALVSNDRGIGATLRAALGSAAAALLWSLYLIVTGILFIGPWLLIAWALWRLTKRKPA